MGGPVQDGWWCRDPARGPDPNPCSEWSDPNPCCSYLHLLRTDSRGPFLPLLPHLFPWVGLQSAPTPCWIWGRPAGLPIPAQGLDCAVTDLYERHDSLFLQIGTNSDCIHFPIQETFLFNYLLFTVMHSLQTLSVTHTLVACSPWSAYKVYVFWTVSIRLQHQILLCSNKQD